MHELGNDHQEAWERFNEKPKQGLPFEQLTSKTKGEVYLLEVINTLSMYRCTFLFLNEKERVLRQVGKKEIGRLVKLYLNMTVESPTAVFHDEIITYPLTSLTL